MWKSDPDQLAQRKCKRRRDEFTLIILCAKYNRERLLMTTNRRNFLKMNWKLWSNEFVRCGNTVWPWCRNSLRGLGVVVIQKKEKIWKFFCGYCQEEATSLGCKCVSPCVTFHHKKLMLHNWNSTKLPETRSKDYQEMKGNTEYFQFEFLKIKGKASAAQN